jgi:protein-tyrosine kinase
MTILEAIERAKLLKKSAVEATTRASPAASPRSARVGAPAAPVASAVLPTHTQFQQYAVNWDACAERRVLVDSHYDRLNSHSSDAYRVLRTRLWHLIDEQQWGSLAITSPGIAEGKSITSLNLALTMALEVRRNIFLLDLDLRRPSICSYLGVTPKVEIGSYLCGEATADETFFSVGIPGLAIAAGRSSYERSAEMLGGNYFPALLADISRRDPHAFVIADLPPLVGVADALVAAPRLAATLLVVAEGRTRRDGLPRALELLKNVTVAGMLLNCSRESLESYYA